MYDVIGHEQVREELLHWDEPFAIVGPDGVGRSGILHEKYKSDPSRVHTWTIAESAVPWVRNFFVWKLTDQNVTDILKRDFPQIMSRALVVSILDGSFKRLSEVHTLVKAVEEVSLLLTTHAVPHVITKPLMEATTQACLHRVTESGWSFSPNAIKVIPEFLALWYLQAEPTLSSTTQFYYGIRDGYVD